LECLAAWKDGSLRYLMGRVQHQGATSDEVRLNAIAPGPIRHDLTILDSSRIATGVSFTSARQRPPQAAPAAARLAPLTAALLTADRPPGPGRLSSLLKAAMPRVADSLLPVKAPGPSNSPKVRRIPLDST